jgi:methylmalonyl-CoA mutase C-terminal domain/subunit
MARKTKVLLSKLGLDVHNRGIITVARVLRNAGMEVIYIGNALPEEIIEVAIQEDVDVIGVSSLGGAHLSLSSELMAKAKQEELKERVVFQIGGVIPPEDVVSLQEIGFDGVFTPGTTSEEIISSIEESLSSKLAR